MAHILLIDDDKALTDLLSEYLRQKGLQVSVRHRGDDALTHLQNSITNESHASTYDMIILDIMMPGIDGLETLKQLRSLQHSAAQLPVLMLTARGDDIDRIVGLELGADDYVPKPAHPRELLARIQAILRRTKVGTDNKSTQQAAEDADTHSQLKRIQVGLLGLNLPARTAMYAHANLSLTSVEFDVLACLASQAGTVVSKADLYQRALGREQDSYDRALDMHISNLRKKLPAENIKTVRGRGYQYAVYHSVNSIETSARPPTVLD